MDNTLKLIYVNQISKNNENMYEYDFWFTNGDINNVWNEEWDCECPSDCLDLSPEEYDDVTIKKLITEIPLYCAQQNTCFSMRHVVDNCICLCCENISEEEVYPEPYRLVFHFGDTLDFINEKLSGRELPLVQ